ncbi:MAG TPA: AbrB/MazE/SpoVT family DNA-binding domain-containing protein [Chloroflexota bacterium]|nr:AbrB/MazE/SpoVT family DNA-binding domain-containing protein [Chloroflexota bacterium]
MARTHLSARGQVVLPKEIRERLHLACGQELSVEIVVDAVVLRPVAPHEERRREDWMSLEGCLKDTDALTDLMNEHRREVTSGR